MDVHLLYLLCVVSAAASARSWSLIHRSLTGMYMCVYVIRKSQQWGGLGLSWDVAWQKKNVITEIGTYEYSNIHYYFASIWELQTLLSTAIWKQEMWTRWCRDRLFMALMWNLSLLSYQLIKRKILSLSDFGKLLLKPSNSGKFTPDYSVTSQRDSILQSHHWENPNLILKILSITNVLVAFSFLLYLVILSQLHKRDSNRL